MPCITNIVPKTFYRTLMKCAVNKTKYLFFNLTLTPLQNYSVKKILKRISYVILFVFIFSVRASSQLQQLSGKVTDIKNNSLPGAGVSLLSFADSLMIISTATDSTGIFFFNSINPGKYFLKVSYVSFDDYFQPIFIKDKPKLVLVKYTFFVLFWELYAFDVIRMKVILINTLKNNIQYIISRLLVLPEIFSCIYIIYKTLPKCGVLCRRALLKQNCQRRMGRDAISVIARFFVPFIHVTMISHIPGIVWI